MAAAAAAAVRSVGNIAPAPGPSCSGGSPASPGIPTASALGLCDMSWGRTELSRTVALFGESIAAGGTCW